MIRSSTNKYINIFVIEDLAKIAKHGRFVHAEIFEHLCAALSTVGIDIANVLDLDIF